MKGCYSRAYRKRNEMIQLISSTRQFLQLTIKTRELSLKLAPSSKDWKVANIMMSHTL